MARAAEIRVPLPVASLLTVDGFLALVAIAGGALALGFLLAFLRLHALVRAGLFLAGPIAAVIASKVIDPEPGCTGDCPAQVAWAILLMSGVIAWWPLARRLHARPLGHVAPNRASSQGKHSRQ